MRKCISLVLGVDEYEHNPKLHYAVYDARKMEQVFQNLKYSVFSCFNPTLAEYTEISNRFIDELVARHYDVAIVYFAGHGLMANGSDYWVMKEASDMRDREGMPAAKSSVRLKDVCDELRQNGDQINILISDACRVDFDQQGENGMRGIITNPAIFGGHSAIPYQTLIAYATSPGASAKETEEMGGVYTSALLSEIMVENQPIEETFKNVRAKLFKHIGDQLPWEHSCLVDTFSFNYGQMSAYYDKPYTESAYKYAKGFAPADEQLLKLINELKGSGDCRRVKGELITRAAQKSAMENDAKFVLGRTISKQAADGNEYCNNMVKNSAFWGLYDEGEVNHLLRGAFYSLYFDENDQLRESLLGDELFWQEMESLYCLIKTKDDVKHFITMSLADVKHQFRYIVGQNRRIRLHVDVETLNCVNSANNELLGLKIIDEDGNNILAELNITDDFFGDDELRSAISRYYQIPMQLISLDSQLRENENKIYTKFRLDDVCDFLCQWMNRYIADEVSTLSSLSYISEVDEVEIEEIQDLEMQLIVQGSCEVSVHIEYDHEEMPDEYFPCTFRLTCDLTDEGEYVVNEEQSNYSVNTDSYYK